MTLKECDTIDLTRISSPNDFIAAASSTETLEQIEEVVTAWVKQIEQVIWILIFSHNNLLLISIIRSSMYNVPLLVLFKYQTAILSLTFHNE